MSEETPEYRVDTALVPIEQKQVVFYDDELTAVLVQDDDRAEVYVPVRPICDFLGVDWSAQRQRILRDAVLATEAKGVVVTTTPGGPQEMTCLPLDYISGFLFGINASRVKDEVRDRLIRYQRECYKVLAEAFREGRLTEEPPARAVTPAQAALEQAAAVYALARAQVMMEARLDDHEQRLEYLEGQLRPSSTVTEDQASQISQAVKAVAMVMTKASGQNQYGSVYGELYRKFGITSYKLLPAARFEEAMAFLTEWHEQLTGESPF